MKHFKTLIKFISVYCLPLGEDSHPVHALSQEYACPHDEEDETEAEED